VHDDDQRKRHRQEMILDAVTLFIAKPIYEKSKFPVDHGHRHDHRNRNAERGDAGEKSDDQAETAEELCGDSKVGEGRGYTEVIAKRLDRGAQAMTAEPTQKFLRAMGEQDDSQDHSCYREHPIRIRGQ